MQLQLLHPRALFRTLSPPLLSPDQLIQLAPAIIRLPGMMLSLQLLLVCTYICIKLHT